MQFTVGANTFQLIKVFSNAEENKKVAFMHPWDREQPYVNGGKKSSRD